MRVPDLDKERSEKKLSLADFMKTYNEGLPSSFPRVSLPLLKEYKKQYASQFNDDGMWSLDLHRKKVMDWLPMYLKLLES